MPPTVISNVAVSRSLGDEATWHDEGFIHDGSGDDRRYFYHHMLISISNISHTQWDTDGEPVWGGF